jgi:hypothetical protein
LLIIATLGPRCKVPLSYSTKISYILNEGAWCSGAIPQHCDDEKFDDDGETESSFMLKCHSLFFLCFEVFSCFQCQNLDTPLRTDTGYTQSGEYEV